MTAHQSAPAPSVQLRHLIIALLVPVYLGTGMALAYLGGFHRPEPHHLPVAVVGSSPQDAVLATTIADRAGTSLSVRTVPDVATADKLVRSGDLVGAYIPHTTTVIVAGASSPTASTAAQQVFDQVAATRDARLHVQDLAPLPADDPQGSNLFFLLVALSVGAYTVAAALGVAGAAARVPHRMRALIGAGVAGLIAAVGTIVADPLLHAVPGSGLRVFAVAWLYATGAVLVGSSLHSFVGRLATPLLVTLFVMLNFTSSGGVLDPRLQNGFFSGLSHFWNGAAFLTATRRVVYDLPGGTGGQLAVLAGWLLFGLLAVGAAALRDRRPVLLAGAAPASEPTAAARTAHADQDEEELEENVGV
jgi:hypothetical protein